MGRPSKYTPELMEAILERLEDGTPLAAICREEGFPSSPNTVRDWATRTPELSARFARACRDGFEQVALDSLRIVDNTAQDFEIVDGKLKVNMELVQRSKLRAEHRLKLLAIWDSARYGNKLQLSGDPKNPVHGKKLSDYTTDELLEAIQQAATTPERDE